MPWTARENDAVGVQTRNCETSGESERAWMRREGAATKALLVNCLPDEQEMYVNHLRHAGFDPIADCAGLRGYSAERARETRPRSHPSSATSVRG